MNDPAAATRGRGLLLWAVILAAPAAADRAPLLERFDEAAAIVEAQFYDAGMNGLDWPAVTAMHRTHIRPDMSREAFAAEFNRMLSRLDASHTMLLTRDDPRWFQLAGIFIDGHPPLRDALEAVLGHADPVYAGIGVMLETRAAGTFVTGVLDGFPADAAGLVVGDRIESAGGEAFHPIRSFAGRDGVRTELVVERRPGKRVEIAVTPTLLDGRTMFRKAMRASATVVTSGGVDVGYIRAWSYAGEGYQQILLDALTNGAPGQAAALVLDLRGGWGGASPSYLNFFVDRSIVVDSVDRAGERVRFASGWARPVVLLVDEGTRSGKELLAYGFRALGKGWSVGETTAGAVLAGRINALSDGSLLYVAVADVRIGGERLEGRGVTPDIVVPFDPAYAAGADPQLERAVAVAVELVGDTGGGNDRP